MFKNFLLCCLFLLLTACAELHESSVFKWYQEPALGKQDGKNLVVPNNLSRYHVGDVYSIPFSNSQGPVPASITPPGFDSIISAKHKSV